MRRVIACFALLFTTLAVAGQTASVTSITPTQGPDSGGTLVTILGSSLSVKVECLLPCPPQVAFGHLVVDAVEISDNRLEVTTPAHPYGTVDLSIMLPGEPPIVIEDAFTFLPGVEAAYERVLLPVYLRGELGGANGSRWRTDFRIRNGGEEPVSLAPWTCPYSVPCLAVFPLTYSLRPGASLHNPPDLAGAGTGNRGQLLYISRDIFSREGARKVAMSLRVSDSSRGGTSAGTELPVIREGEQYQGKVELFDIPMSNRGYRILLRVYDLTYGQARFLVRLYDQDNDEDFAVHTVELNATTSREAPFREEPAYAQLDFEELLKLRKAWPASVRIEIEPLTPGSRYWAFASITSNETQFVTLATPQ